MVCPYCRSTETKVTDKRPSADQKAIRRRRECLQCEKRFTTYERVEAVDLFVIKKDGRRERFDPSKLKRGLMRACEKRPVSLEKVEAVVEKIEKELRRLKTKEVESIKVGEKVMRELKRLDKVAYIRFASVYRDFQDVKDFEQEIKKMR